MVRFQSLQHPGKKKLSEGRAVFSPWPLHPTLEDLSDLAITVGARFVVLVMVTLTTNQRGVAF